MDPDYPIFLVDENRCKANILRMAKKAEANRVFFRPHVKTHQSADVADWFKPLGVTAITVSSLKMARYFAGAGWRDIFIAFPVNILESNHLNQLAQKVRLTLSVESLEVARYISQRITHPVDVMIKIDTGTHRTGLDPENPEIQKILDHITDHSKHSFRGFYTHAGETYQVRGPEAVGGIYRRTAKLLAGLKNSITTPENDLVLSVGDTPSCSLVDHFEGMDEIRPGNFVFYDLMQVRIGACEIQDIALVLLCPVVAKHPSRLELVVHGGAVHLSGEKIEYQGRMCFGWVVPADEKGWGDPIEGVYVDRISQEHGIVKATPGFFENVRIGDRIGILPVHSCLTANLAEYYRTTSGVDLSKMRS